MSANPVMNDKRSPALWPGIASDVFTADNLREILRRVVKQGSTKLPGRTT